MGTYKPTAEDFSHLDSGSTYQPSIEDFEPEENAEQAMPGSSAMEDQEPQKLGWKGVGQDALSSLTESLKGIAGFARRLPSNTKEMASNLIKNPLDYGKHIENQLFASLGETGKSILNLPYNAIQELGKQGVAPDWLVKYSNLPFTHIPEDTGVEKLLGLEPKYQSDEVIRAIPDIATIGLGAKNVAKSVTTASKLKKAQAAFKSALEELNEKKSLNEKELKDLQTKLRQTYTDTWLGEKLGEGDPISMYENMRGKEAKVNAAQEKIKELPENVEHPGAEPDVKAAEDSLADALEAGEAHAEQGATNLRRRILEDKEEASRLYNEYKEDISKVNVPIKNNAAIKSAKNLYEELVNSDALAPGYGSGTPEQVALHHHIRALENETVSASDLFVAKRDLDHAIDKLNDQYYNGNLNETKKREVKALRDKAEIESSRLGRILENSGPPEVAEKLRRANSMWADWHGALRHPVARAALKSNAARLQPGSIGKINMRPVEGEGRGDIYLRKIVSEDPRLQRNLLSLKYSKPGQFQHLLEPTAETRPFLQNREDLDPYIEALREAKHEKTTYQERKKAYDEKTQAEKEIPKLKEQIEFHKKAIDEVNKQKSKIESTSKQHKELEKKAAQHKEEMEAKLEKLKKFRKTIKRIGLAFGANKLYNSRN